VVHLVTALEIGGLEVVVANLVRHASPRFHQHVICLEGLGPIASRIESRDVKIEVIGDPGTQVWRSVRELRRRLKELRPDVLHTHNEKAHIRGALALLGWRGAPKLVHTRHGRSRVTGRRAQMANRLALKRSAFLVSVSDDANLIALAEGARYERARVIQNGVDVQAFDASGYEERAGRMRAVMVCRLSPVKDVATMIRATRIIVNSHPDFHLDIVGDGPARQSLQTLQRVLGLERHVTFHGAQEDVRPYLQQATVFVQSSLSEGISLTLLEAMAAGLPVVATDVGGTAEVVQKGTTGVLVEPENVDALAAAVIRLLTDRAQLVSMSRAARERAERCFDVRQMAAAYEALYADGASRAPHDPMASGILTLSGR
jgi:glycosyltransferase involved in cell wall biosynthesis